MNHQLAGREFFDLDCWDALRTGSAGRHKLTIISGADPYQSWLQDPS
jgi:hypothetical protein